MSSEYITCTFSIDSLSYYFSIAQVIHSSVSIVDLFKSGTWDILAMGSCWNIHYRPQGKVMFSESPVILFTGVTSCLAAWSRVLPTRGVCLLGGLPNRGCLLETPQWWRQVTATAVVGMHPTGMHSCFCVCLRIWNWAETIFFYRANHWVLNDQQLCGNQQTWHNIFHIHLSRILHYLKRIIPHRIQIIVSNYDDCAILN